MPFVRHRTDRWELLRALANRLEHLIEANVALDQLTAGNARATVANAAALQRQLDDLCARISDETTRLTVEQLRAELRARQQGRLP